MKMEICFDGRNVRSAECIGDIVMPRSLFEHIQDYAKTKKEEVQGILKGRIINHPIETDKDFRYEVYQVIVLRSRESDAGTTEAIYATNRKPEEGYFHTHTLNTIGKFGIKYAYYFSIGDFRTAEEFVRIKGNPTICLLVTPEGGKGLLVKLTERGDVNYYGLEVKIPRIEYIENIENPIVNPVQYFFNPSTNEIYSFNPRTKERGVIDPNTIAIFDLNEQKARIFVPTERNTYRLLEGSISTILLNYIL